MSALLTSLTVLVVTGRRPVLPPAPAPAGPMVPTRTSPSAGTPRTLHLVAALAAAAAAALVLPGALGLVGALVAGGAVWVRSGSWEGAMLRRRRAQLEADLPFVVDLMLSALAVGADPATALGEVADAVGGVTAEELAPCLARLRLGADPVSVWSELAAHPVLGRLGLTLHRSVESGAPVVAALSRLAHDLLARRRSEVESRVRQIEVKAAVPLGVCLLPSFVLVAVVPLVAGSVIGFLLGG